MSTQSNDTRCCEPPTPLCPHPMGVREAEGLTYLYDVRCACMDGYCDADHGRNNNVFCERTRPLADVRAEWFCPSCREARKTFAARYPEIEARR